MASPELRVADDETHTVLDGETETYAQVLAHGTVENEGTIQATGIGEIAAGGEGGATDSASNAILGRFPVAHGQAAALGAAVATAFADVGADGQATATGASDAATFAKPEAAGIASATGEAAITPRAAIEAMGAAAATGDAVADAIVPATRRDEFDIEWRSDDITLSLDD